MDIKKWFENKGSYADGLALYAQIKGCQRLLLTKLAQENTQNFLMLKYELKMALSTAGGVTIPTKQNVAPQPAVPKKEPLLEVIIKESTEAQFEKETMAMYPVELHGVYRARVSDFYRACEIKFKLNALEPDDEDTALDILMELEALWDAIDNAWIVLHHWRDHKRIMPVEVSEDFTVLNGIQLVKRRGQLETSKSKREKTIAAMEIAAQDAPEDKRKANLLNRKKEQLQQIIIDLDTVRAILQKDGKA